MCRSSIVIGLGRVPNLKRPKFVLAIVQKTVDQRKRISAVGKRFRHFQTFHLWLAVNGRGLKIYLFKAAIILDRVELDQAEIAYRHVFSIRIKDKVRVRTELEKSFASQKGISAFQGVRKFDLLYFIEAVISILREHSKMIRQYFSRCFLPDIDAEGTRTNDTDQYHSQNQEDNYLGGRAAFFGPRRFYEMRRLRLIPSVRSENSRLRIFG